MLKIMTALLLITAPVFATSEEEIRAVEASINAQKAITKTTFGAKLLSELAAKEFQQTLEFCRKEISMLKAESEAVKSDVSKIIELMAQTEDEKNRANLDRNLASIDNLRERLITGNYDFFKRHSRIIRTLDTFGYDLERYLENLKKYREQTSDPLTQVKIDKIIASITNLRIASIALKDDLNKKSTAFSQKIDLVLESSDLRRDSLFFRGLEARSVGILDRFTAFFAMDRLSDKSIELGRWDPALAQAYRYLDFSTILDILNQKIAAFSVIRKDFDKIPGSSGPDGDVFRGNLNVRERILETEKKNLMTKGWQFFAKGRTNLVNRAIETNLAPKTECKNLYDAFLANQDLERTYEQYLLETAQYSKIFDTCFRR